MGTDPTLELREDCAGHRMSALPSGRDALNRHRKVMTALVWHGGSGPVAHRTKVEENSAVRGSTLQQG